MSLDGQVAIVTGGSRGIGAASSRLLASRGARVVLTYREQADRAEALVAEIRTAGGEAMALRSDVRDTDQIRQLAEHTIATYGRVDILVSNAPVGWSGKSFREISWDEFRSVVDGELKAAFELTRSVLPTMTAQRRGRLIYLSSGLATHHPIPGKLAAATAKASLAMFVRYLAEELGASGITANAVAPGLVETEVNADMPAAEKAQIAAVTPLRRLASPEDVAKVVGFLAGDDGGFLTGITIPVNGGLAME